MKIISLFWLLSLTLGFTQAYAYGTSSSTKSCEKPRFSEFNPVDKAQVAPHSAFSFLASATTNPKSIVVEMKKQTVDITVTNKAQQGYLVSGHFPNNLKNTAARINISAETISNCKANGGWLIYITE